MNICIYGLGAIGGLIGASLALHGHAVTAVARGSTLEAARRQGLTLIAQDGTRQIAPLTTVTADPATLGPQAVVVLAVKTSGLPAVASAIAPLLGPETVVLSAMNGIPWWFTHGLGEAAAGLRLDSVDPAGTISQALAPQRVVGCVTHLSAATPEPAVIRRVAGNRLILGEPGGGADTPRAMALIAALRGAGFQVDAADSIQREIWFKLWGNMTMNPVSALAGATADRILDDPLVRAFLSRCMREAAAIGARIGLPIDADPEERHALTRALGAVKTSMLQDVEAGKPVELDALVAVVREMGAQVGIPTPELDTLFGLARLHAAGRGLYPAVGPQQ